MRSSVRPPVCPCGEAHDPRGHLGACLLPCMSVVRVYACLARQGRVTAMVDCVSHDAGLACTVCRTVENWEGHRAS